MKDNAGLYNDFDPDTERRVEALLARMTLEEKVGQLVQINPFAPWTDEEHAAYEAEKQAAEEAEVMAGVEISRAYVGIAGSDIRSVNSRAIVSVSGRHREISRADINRVIEAAQSAALPSDREILHAVPQEFVVDEQTGITEPLGMLGSRLEVSIHLTTGNTTRPLVMVSIQAGMALGGPASSALFAHLVVGWPSPRTHTTALALLDTEGRPAIVHLNDGTRLVVRSRELVR